MPVSAWTMAGALEEMKEASDTIPTLKDHIIRNRASPLGTIKDQNKTVYYVEFRDGTLWHTHLGNREVTEGRSVALSLPFFRPFVDAVLSGVSPSLLSQSDPFSLVVPENPL